MSDYVQDNVPRSSRRDMQRRFEALRLGERSEVIAEKSEVIAEKSEVIAEKSEVIAEKGFDGDGYAPNNVATDIFRKAVGLGGHLVVAFVAPVGASDSRTRQGLRARPSRIEAEAAISRAVLRRLIEQFLTKPVPHVGGAGSRPTSVSPYPWEEPKD